jgi:hypothetical protein
MMDILGVSGNQCTQPWRMFFLGTMIGLRVLVGLQVQAGILEALDGATDYMPP